MGTTAPGQPDLAEENERLRVRVAELEEAEREKAELLIENGRLRLERQVLRAGLAVLGEPPADDAGVLARVLETAKALCGASAGSVMRLAGDYLVLEALWGERLLVGRQLAQEFSGAPPVLAGPYRRSPEYPFWRALLEQRVVHVPDIAALRSDDEVAAALIAEGRERGIRTHLYAPLRRGDDVIGVLGLFRDAHESGPDGGGAARPFREQEIAAAETLAAQVVIALENARLFSELNASNATLTEALEQQTATAEVLRAIAASPAEPDHVLQSIVEAALRLVRSHGATIFMLEGEALYRRASASLREAAFQRGDTGAQGKDRGIPLTDRRTSACAVAEQRVVHVPDIEAEGDAYPASLRNARESGWRAALAVPLLGAGNAIGVVSLVRVQPEPFTDQEIALVRSFADQGVVAIENARLIAELRERDDRRRLELERASAIQRRLLPEGVQGWPGVLEVAARFRPAVETSGDFYDVLALPTARKGELEPLQIAVGDVAGKGMAAALVTALARSALHASASMPTAAVTPAGTLRVAGQRLHRDVGSAHFVACALAVVEPPGLLNRGPLLRLANAAQVPVLLCRDGAAAEVEPPGDRLPLGARPEGGYEDAKVELRPGDVVVLSSDGLVEAPSLRAAEVPSHLPTPSAPSELFGFARLGASASHWSSHAGTAEEVAAGMWADLTAWCGEESHHDDVTLLVLRVPRT